MRERTTRRLGGGLQPLDAGQPGGRTRIAVGADLPKDAPRSTQERAYTSPIWYAPEG